jgi:peptide/nickel transport system substrate-binding protein
MTAADVKYSLERARSGKVGYYLSAVDQVRVIDDLVVEVTTLKPASILLNKLTFISIIPQNSPKPLEIPVGTGPYRFIKYQPGGDMELRAFDRHWKGRPSIKRAVFRTMPEEGKRVEALLAGQVHLVRDVERRTAQENTDHPLASFVNSPGLGVSLMGVNFGQPGPWKDRRVREAIYLAIDPVEAAQASGWDALPIDQMVSPYIVGYNPDIRVRRPDLERAKVLLAEAGYSRGFELPLELSRSAANTSGAVLASQLAKVGIRVRLVPLEWPELTDRLNRRETHVFLVGWSCSSGDASDLFDACLHSGGTAGYGSVNWSGYSNRKLDALIERSNQVLDNRERIEILKQAMILAMADYPMIPIFSRNRIYGASHKIVFLPRQDGRIRIDEISYRQ